MKFHFKTDALYKDDELSEHKHDSCDKSEVNNNSKNTSNKNHAEHSTENNENIDEGDKEKEAHVSNPAEKPKYHSVTIKLLNLSSTHWNVLKL